MTTLAVRIMNDLKQAMKEKDQLKKGVLQLLKAGLQNEAIKLRRELTNEDELTVINREFKQTEIAMKEAEKLNRLDVAEREKTKMEIILQYLPKQLSEKEIYERLVTLGVQKDMVLGQAMGIAMANLKGQANGNIINKVVNEILATN